MRPRVPDDCPAEIGELMEECWLEDHLARPPFDRVLDIFEKFARGIQREASLLPAAVPDEGELASRGASAALGAASGTASETASGTASNTASRAVSGAASSAAEPGLTQREIRRRQQRQLEERKKASSKKAPRASPKKAKPTVTPTSSPKKKTAKNTVSAPQAALPPVREQRKHAAPKDSRRGSVTEYPAHLDQWSV